MRLALASILTLGLAAAAPAVIIDSDDGSGNVTAPVPEDPGWSYVGIRGGLTAVSLGGRFVLTASHVGPGNVVLGGVSYTFVPGTDVQLSNSNPNDPPPDLLMFQIHPPAPLPPLPIWNGSLRPGIDTELILIGFGLNRGPVTSFDCPGPGGPSGGYEWGAANAMRWGTNFVEDQRTIDIPQINPTTRTLAFGSIFEATGSNHEAQAAVGDSGGAAFALNGTQWELAGILFAIGTCTGQPLAALYGNATYAADLFFYRDEIADVMMPEPSGGLWAGALMVAALGAASRSPRPRR